MLLQLTVSPHLFYVLSFNMYTRSFYLLSILVFRSYNLILSYSVDPTSFTAVLDVDGQEVEAAGKYYILPAALQGGGKGGGGLALSSRDGTCPFYVMQENQEQSNGLPVRFLAMNNTRADANIGVSTDINIVFRAATTCVQSMGWKVGAVDQITGRRYIRSGALTGRPGVGTVNNWFKVEKNENGDGYTIVFCPSVCSFCKVVCGNVGVFEENGRKWLGLSDVEPLFVKFEKA